MVLTYGSVACLYGDIVDLPYLLIWFTLLEMRNFRLKIFYQPIDSIDMISLQTCLRGSVARPMQPGWKSRTQHKGWGLNLLYYTRSLQLENFWQLVMLIPRVMTKHCALADTKETCTYVIMWKTFNELHNFWNVKKILQRRL